MIKRNLKKTWINENIQIKIKIIFDNKSDLLNYKTNIVRKNVMIYWETRPYLYKKKDFLY
jgi:hypothetical protein